MAGSSLYHDDDDAAAITDINVTPFVDVVLVLLVVFIVTAKLIVARGVEVDTPKEAIAGEVNATLRVTVTSDGQLFVRGEKFTNDAAAVARLKELAALVSKPKALIAGDRRSAYGGVMHAIELVQEAGITAISLENKQP